MSKKTGKLTKEECDFILDNKDRMTFEEMASHLQRRPGVIADFVHRNVDTLTDPEKLDQEAKYQLRSRPYYKNLQGQFTNSELDVIEYHYRKMYSQFKDDVFHTEEMQIIDICKLEILCERILRAQGESRRKIDDLECEIRLEKAKGDKANWDMNYIAICERQISALQISLKSMSEEYRDFMTRKNSMFKDIKGTRADRIKIIEDQKESWSKLLIRLIEDSEYRKQFGLDIEKHRLAMEKEIKRLGQDIVYDDGLVDKPLLTEETLLND